MASEIKVDTIVNAGGDNDTGIDLATNDNIKFNIAGSQKAMVDSSGNLLVVKTSADSGATAGIELRNDGNVRITKDGGSTTAFNRLTSDGTIVTLQKDGSTVGSIGVVSSDNVFIGGTASDHGGILFNDTGGGQPAIQPCSVSGTLADNSVNLGSGGNRFNDLFATNGTIQTSDQNEKNTITDSDLGLDFVNRLAPKSYIFNGKTRTHYGLIAQDVETVLSDISKETSEFAGFIKTDISEEQDGSQYRYGLRYTEFVGILIKALQEADDKIDALTAKVTALESE